MSLGLVGHKAGMTRTFTDDGDSISATVLEVDDNRVAQIRTDEADGCAAVQATFSTQRTSHVTKSLADHLAKTGVEAGEVIKELRVDAARATGFQPGVNISVDLFEVGQKIDVQGMTIGKDYTGTIECYDFLSGRASHGDSRSHNVPGSIGMTQDPGHVSPGKRMTGHMGGVTHTVRNLKIVKVDAEHKLLLVKGMIPDAKGGQTIVTPAMKTCAKKA